MTATRTPPGELLRQWRVRRRYSQLDLATRADVSTRHLSFVETGRARPSPEMILHLAEHLAVPLRERNRILLAAGYAPRYGQSALDDPDLTPVRDALQLVLDAHPYPAFAVDGRWNLVDANHAASAFIAMIDPALLTPPVNVIRLTVHPNGLAPRIVNFAEYADHLVARLRQTAELTADDDLISLLAEVLDYLPETSRHALDTFGGAGTSAVLPMVIATDIGEVRTFSMLVRLGSPLDVTLDELTVETFYPMDADSRELLTRLSALPQLVDAT